MVIFDYYYNVLLKEGKVANENIPKLAMKEAEEMVDELKQKNLLK